jgi:hypothetical protein
MMLQFDATDYHFLLAQQPLVGQGPLVIGDLRSHSDTPSLSRTPVDEWSARRRDLYLTEHNTHKGKTSVPPAGIEHPIPASEWP